MPQKRNPDVFELVRGRGAVAQSCLTEVLGIVAKLPSGYQRDLQLIKPPLFRGIDLALSTAAIMAVGIEGVRFRPEAVKLDPAIRSQRAGGPRGHPVPRSVPAHRREIPQMTGLRVGPVRHERGVDVDLVRHSKRR
jgi:hypothetical protein